MSTLLRAFLISFAFLAMFVATTVHAEGTSGTNAQFGAVYGSSVPDSDNTKPYWMTGVKGAAYVLPVLSLGGYYYWSDSSGEPSSTEKFRYSLHGIEAAYHLAAGSGEVAIGLRGGFSKVETETSGNKVVYSPYHLGFSTGYDYFVAPWFSVGFEGSLVHVKKSNTTESAVDYTLDAFNIISFLVTVQFRM